MFDKCPGGLGISDAIFSHRGSCLRLALDLLKDCTCHGTGGCPKCVASHSCADYNSVLDKVKRSWPALFFFMLHLQATTSLTPDVAIHLFRRNIGLERCDHNVIHCIASNGRPRGAIKAEK